MLTFLKLGGSLITEKNNPSTALPEELLELQKKLHLR